MVHALRLQLRRMYQQHGTYAQFAFSSLFQGDTTHLGVHFKFYTYRDTSSLRMTHFYSKIWGSQS
jgi:hypothetical protein